MVLLDSIINLFQPIVLLGMLFGVVWGIICGALPGFGASLGISLLLPFTYGMDAMVALPMLSGVYAGAMYGGSITAILVGVPGTSAAAATVFDGLELAKQGKANTALSAAVLASAFGGIFSGIILIAVAPLLAKVAIMFGPAEYFLLAIFGLTVIASLSSGSTLKGVLAGLLGLVFGMVGLDPIRGYMRFTFGQMYLFDGFPTIPLILGLFAFPRCVEFTKSIFKGEAMSVSSDINASGGAAMKIREIFGMWKTLVRSSVLGTIIGIIPAAGANIACFVGYSEAKRKSKNPDSFGKGNPEGVVAAEAANNAVCGGSLVPLLTLSIPGNATAAVILGGLMIHGLVPGPQLFEKYADVTYAFMMSVVVANIPMALIGYYGARAFAKIAQIPLNILAPVMLLLSLLGSFSTRQVAFDMWVTIGIGLVCYLLMQAKFPMPPILLGTILGPIAEKGFRQAMLISHNNMAIFVQRPLSIMLIGLIILSLYASTRMAQTTKKQKAQ